MSVWLSERAQQTRQIAAGMERFMVAIPWAIDRALNPDNFDLAQQASLRMDSEVIQKAFQVIVETATQWPFLENPRRAADAFVKKFGASLLESATPETVKAWEKTQLLQLPFIPREKYALKATMVFLFGIDMLLWRLCKT